VGAFLAVWQLLGSSQLVRSDLISYPTEVVAVGVQLAASGELTRHGLVSLREFVVGFIPAAAVGILLGLWMSQSRRLRYLLDPLVMAMYTAPRIALIPVLVLWLGIGLESKAAVVFLGAVFPVLINTVAGAQQIDQLWVRAVRAFGANRFQLMTKVVLPGSLPAVMAGIRLGLGRAIISVIVAEMYASVDGIGRLLQGYSSAGRTAETIVLVGVVAMAGYLAVVAVRAIEERVQPWVRELEP